MIGYKALNEDMTSQYGDMTYELNKWYQIEGELQMCKNGFHFCDTFEKTLKFYSLKGSRFFKVETDGKIITSPEKNVTEKIRLVEEIQITDDMIDDFVKSKIPFVRLAIAEYGRPRDLDILVKDDDWRVRYAVAEHGRNKNLSILVHDENEQVRCTVAKQGRPQDLDILVYDNNADVRHAVAMYGRSQDLDILVKDDVLRVRYAAIGQGRPPLPNLIFCSPGNCEY